MGKSDFNYVGNYRRTPDKPHHAMKTYSGTRPNLYRSLCGSVLIERSSPFSSPNVDVVTCKKCISIMTKSGLIEDHSKNKIKGDHKDLIYLVWDPEKILMLDGYSICETAEEIGETFIEAVKEEGLEEEDFPIVFELNLKRLEMRKLHPETSYTLKFS